MAKFNSDESDQNRSDAADDGAHERAPLALPIVKSGGGTSEAADESGTPSEQHGETATPPPPSPHDDDIAVDEARQASPAPSVLTLTPSLRENFYSEEFGRALNSLSGVYKLPADAQEMSRLDGLHWAFKAFYGGVNYVGPVKLALQPEPNVEKRILDLGCGSGKWVQEIGEEFPHCTVIGVDLAPTIGDLPLNCRHWYHLRVEVDDINLGLEHFAGQFNFVHARFISPGIRDYPETMAQICQCLCPGGMVLLMDYDYHCYTSSFELLNPLEPSDPRYQYAPVFLNEMSKSIERLGGIPDAPRFFHLLSQEELGLGNIELGDMSFPLGPPYPTPSNAEEHAKNFRGMLMAQLVIDFADAAKPQLLTAGMSDEAADRLIYGVKHEMSGSTNMYVRMHYGWAIKKTPEEEERERAEREALERAMAEQGDIAIL